MKRENKLVVGDLRHQSAWIDGNCPVVIIPSPGLEDFLQGKKLVAVRSYPDTTDENGGWNATFKIQIALDGEEVSR